MFGCRHITEANRFTRPSIGHGDWWWLSTLKMTAVRVEFEKYLKSGSGRAFALRHFW